MYLPKQFDQQDQSLALEVMRANNFATMVTTDADGLPFATHLPLVVTADEDGILIEGHVAKPNPHSKQLFSNPLALFIFQGPHAYMSPSVYPDLARVPTWNYIAIHAIASVVAIDDEVGKDGLLKKLIAIHEPSYAEQWRGLDLDFQSKMLSGIVAFKASVTKLESKFKLNQHRKESHTKMHSVYANGNADEQALAVWMARLGLVGH